MLNKVERDLIYVLDFHHFYKEDNICDFPYAGVPINSYSSQLILIFVNSYSSISFGQFVLILVNSY